MRYPGKWGATPMDNWNERLRAVDFMRVRGTPKIPQPPRDVLAQSGPRGVFLTWSLPAVYRDISGWRIYKNDEHTLFAEIRDRGTRQEFVEATASTASVAVNLFVSSINDFGRESVKIQVQGKAANEAGAPTMPNTPPNYSTGWAGGGNLSSGAGFFKFSGPRN